MKHTPGPWKVGTRDKVINYFPIYARIGVTKMARIATTDGHEVGFGISEKEMEANAALIAAAPEILEALKLCVPELRGWMRNHGEDIRTVEAIEKAKAAIQKAERS